MILWFLGLSRRGRAPWWGETWAQPLTLLVARTYPFTSSTCGLNSLWFFLFPASPFSFPASHPPLQPLLLSLCLIDNTKFPNLNVVRTSPKVNSSLDKYEQLCRYPGQGAAVSWTRETAPRPDLVCTQKKVNPSGPSMPSKPAALLTLGNLSQTHMSCLCLTCFPSPKQRGLPPVSFWSLSSFLFSFVFFFFFLLYSIINKNFLIISDLTLSKFHVMMTQQGNERREMYLRIGLVTLRLWSGKKFRSDVNVSVVSLEPPLAKGQSVIGALPRRDALCPCSAKKEL